MSEGPQTTALPSSGGAPAEALDLTGRALGDFRVLRRLGQGGMGQVYLAEQVSLRRKVALKILRPDLAATPGALERFRHEAESVAQATHANIVQVYAFGQADGVAFMALEYVEGRNLREYLARKGPPDVLLALSVMRQVAAALARAGELGIIHRDVKPENILLTRKGEVKVADFGLSRCLAGDRPAPHLTQSGVTMGTPLYMSPEQVEGKPVDPRTDIYSFGVTCYHMLAGHPPFRGDSAFEVALQHVRAEPPPLSALRPDLPEPLCALVHRMMAKDPALRPQTGRDLLREVLRLREALSGQTGPVGLGPPTVVAEPIPAVTAPAPSAPARPRRRLAPLVVGSLLLAAGGGALAAWAQRRAPAPAVDPADASTVEAICLPHKREQALRDMAELYLGARDDKDTAGFGSCLALGVFYLEEDRLDDAEKLFARLDGRKDVRADRFLGGLGRGVVAALRNRPRESYQLLRAALAEWVKAPRKPDPLVRQVVESQSFRYWVAKACWYNQKNGVREQVLGLRRLVPALPEGPPAPPGKK
jgi:eukaryotic-like serine/threonine-protein kinase